MKTLLPIPLFRLGMSLLLGAVSLSAGELDRSRIEEDAQWLIHVDADAFKRTQTGKFVLQHILIPQVRPHATKLNLDAEKLLEQVHGLTAYGRNAKGQDDSKAVLVIDMDPAMKSLIKGILVQHAGNAKSPEKPPIQVSNEKGNPVFSFHDEIHSTFMEDGPIVLSKNRDHLTAACDLVSGKGKGLAAEGTFIDYPDTSTGDFMVAVAEDFNTKTEMPPLAKSLQMTQGARVSLSEADKKLRLGINLRTESGQLANQVQAVIQGVIAFAMLSAENETLSSLIHNSRVEVKDRYVNINLNVPIEEAIAAIAKESVTGKAAP